MQDTKEGQTHHCAGCETAGKENSELKQKLAAAEVSIGKLTAANEEMKARDKDGRKLLRQEAAKQSALNAVLGILTTERCMMIQNKIIEQQVIFESATGKKARNVYLGREDMKDLLKWAQLNCYIMEAGSANIEGLDRPKVSGLKCFEVNADRHIECA